MTTKRDILESALLVETECIHQAGYLLIKASGPWTQETATQLIDRAKTEATSGGYQRILFDLTRLQKPSREMVRFSSGEHLAIEFAGRFKAAAFTLPENINRFGETVARNRGAWFRVFADEISAIEWLMGEGRAIGRRQD